LADAAGTAVVPAFGRVWLVSIPLDVFWLHWLAPPDRVSRAGGAAVLVGAALTPLAVWENRFATPNVQEQPDQTVLRTGMYGLILPPIYLGKPARGRTRTLAGQHGRVLGLRRPAPRSHRPRITGKRTGNATSRASGWAFVHVCIDDASRLAFSQVLPDEKNETAVAFLKAAVTDYASLGKTCATLGLRHIFSRPHTPKTNGKAERFIQTASESGPTPSPIPVQPSAPTHCLFGIARTAD
jgi:hypothetical protein